MMIENDSQTKISISKSLHSIVKDICRENGLKMQFFEDKAIFQYIEQNYPDYIDDLPELNGNNKKQKK